MAGPSAIGSSVDGSGAVWSKFREGSVEGISNSTVSTKFGSDTLVVSFPVVLAELGLGNVSDVLVFYF